MSSNKPFIETLAAFRGISYEEAEKQYREDVLIDTTEYTMVSGRSVQELVEERDALMFEVSPEEEQRGADCQRKTSR